MTPVSPLLVAQITDTHLFAEVDRTWKGLSTAHTLKTVLDRLQEIQPQPDLLLLTGDLSQDETPASYELLTSLIAPLKIPTYWIPGNVDRYPQIKIVLCGHIHQEFNQQRGSVTYLGTPSTCIQLLPKSHPIILDEIPPGFRLLELAIDGTWNTRVERVAEESPPN